MVSSSTLVLHRRPRQSLTALRCARMPPARYICTGCIARLVLYRRWSLTYCHSLPGHNAFPTLADPPGSSTCFSAPCGGRRPFGSSTQTSIHAGRRALDNYLPAHSVTQAARSTQPRKNISIWFWPTSRTDDARCTENHVYLTHQSLLSTSDNNDAKKRTRV